MCELYLCSLISSSLDSRQMHYPRPHRSFLEYLIQFHLTPESQIASRENWMQTPPYFQTAQCLWMLKDLNT